MDYLQLFCYICHKLNLNCGGSYIDSPDWIKNKKETINPIKNPNNKSHFQYSVTVVVNYEKIREEPQRITKIKPFINKYSYYEINYPSEKDNWKIFEQKNVTIALNVLYAEKEKIYLGSVSKHTSNPEK